MSEANWFICECGSNRFFKTISGKVNMCVNCETVYNNKCEKIGHMVKNEYKSVKIPGLEEVK